MAEYKSLIDSIVNRNEALKTDRSTFMATWSKVRRYVLPEYPDVYGPIEQNFFTPSRRFDGTPILANRFLSGLIHVMLTSPVRKFCQLTVEDGKLRKKESVRRYLQAASEELYNKFQRSNYNKTVSQFWTAFTSIGCGGRLFEDWNNEGTFFFQTIPMNELCVEEGIDGRVDTMYREYKMTARHIAQKWPAAEGVAEVAKWLKEDSRHLLTLLHYIGPAIESEQRWMAAGKLHKYMSAQILLEGNEKAILNAREEGLAGYEDKPFSFPRWCPISGSPYAASPGIWAMDDIEVLNIIHEWKLKGIMLNVMPPLGCKGSAFDALPETILPGQRIALERADEIAPLFTGVNPEVAELQIEFYRQRIDAFYYKNELQVYPDKNYMTALEFATREGDRLRIMGTSVAQAIDELMDLEVLRGFDIARKSNKDLKSLPEGLTREKLKVEYLSPLVKAMRLDERQALQNFMGMLMEMAQYKPGVLELLKDDVWMERAADLTGVDLDMVKSSKEYKALVEKQQRLAEEQQMAETAKTAANAYQSAARGEASLRK